LPGEKLRLRKPLRDRFTQFGRFFRHVRAHRKMGFGIKSLLVRRQTLFQFQQPIAHGGLGDDEFGMRGLFFNFLA
jgi:hypothetical protein